MTMLTNAAKLSWAEHGHIHMLAHCTADDIHRSFGNTDMISTAAAHGRLDMVKALVTRGALNTTPPFRYYPDLPLMNACLHGRHDVVEYLLPFFLPLNQHLRGSRKMPCAEGDIGRRMLLLARKAAQNGLSMWKLIQPHLDLSPTHWPVADAAVYMHMDLVEHMLNAGCSLAAKTLDNLNLLDTVMLHAAVNSGWRQLFERLLAQGAPTSTAPWHIPIANDDVDTLTALLRHGVDVNAQYLCSRTAVCMASSRGHVRSLQVLLAAGANPNVSGHGSLILENWPLLEALKNMRVDIVAMLLACPRTDVYCRGSGVCIPTLLIDTYFGGTDGRHYNPKAAACGKTILGLLVNAGFDINAMNRDRKSLLTRAIVTDKPETVALMLELGADPNRCGDVGCAFAWDCHLITSVIDSLQYRRAVNTEPILELLILAGADICCDDVEDRLSQGDDAPEMARAYWRACRHDYLAHLPLPDTAYVREHKHELMAITNRCQPLSLFDTVRRYLYNAEDDVVSWQPLPLEVVTALKRQTFYYQPTATWARHMDALKAEDPAIGQVHDAVKSFQWRQLHYGLTCAAAE